MEVEVRTARKDDAGPVAELMYSSGMDLYDYLYGAKTLDFLRYEFQSGKGFAGYKHVTVAVHQGEVVGTGCFYDRESYNGLLKGTMKNMREFFGLVGVVPVLLRSRHISSVMRTPKPGEMYLSNFGVSQAMRSQGIGSKIIKHKLEEARQQGFTIFGLDVSAGNPRGEALYTRLGLKVIKEKTFSNKKADVKPARKMELTL